MVLEMFFFTFNNTNIQFAWKKLISRFYTAIKALSTTKQVEIIDKKKFAKTALDKNVEPFIIHVIFFSINLMPMHLAQKAQTALLLTKKIKILTKYLDFLDVFLGKKAFGFTKNIQLKLVYYKTLKKSSTTL